MRYLVLGLCALALVPAASAARLPGIVSPTGNIRCLYVPPARGNGPVNLLCSIARSAYATRLQDHCMAPNGSGVDWHGFELGATRRGQILCTGGILYDPGTQHPHYVTLSYGRTWHQSVFTCTSRATGLTCTNRSGHGLFISRDSWRTW
jgi:hypothetical protein